MLQQDSVAGQGEMEALLSCSQSGGQQSQPRMAVLLERDRAEMLPGISHQQQRLWS